MVHGNKTTVSQLHKTKIDEIAELESSIPNLQLELDDLNHKLSSLDIKYDIIRYKDLESEIRKIKEKIDNLSSLRMKYFKKSGILIHQYLELDKKPRVRLSGLDLLGKKEFNEEICQRTQMYRRLRSSIDPDYVHVDEDAINEENYCYECKEFRVSMSEEAVMVCLKCGSQVTVTQKYTKPSMNDPPAENKIYEYQRFSRFCEWIENIQAKESKIVPDAVIEAVKREIKREMKTDKLDQLDERDIRKYLKKYKNKKYDQYYDNCTQILKRVTGIEPLQMTQEMENDLQNMFMAIQEPFEIYKDKRHNFSSYSYTLYKLCQLLGYNEFLPKFRLHKNESKIYEHDQIWKKICEYMGGEEKGWKFIKSYLY